MARVSRTPIHGLWILGSFTRSCRHKPGRLQQQPSRPRCYVRALVAARGTRAGMSSLFVYLSCFSPSSTQELLLRSLTSGWRTRSSSVNPGVAPCPWEDPDIVDQPLAVSQPLSASPGQLAVSPAVGGLTSHWCRDGSPDRCRGGPPAPPRGHRPAPSRASVHCATLWPHHGRP